MASVLKDTPITWLFRRWPRCVPYGSERRIRLSVLDGPGWIFIADEG